MAARLGDHGQVGGVPHEEEDAHRLHEGDRPGAFHLVGGGVGGGSDYELQRALHVHRKDRSHQGARDPRRCAARAGSLFCCLAHSN